MSSPFPGMNPYLEAPDRWPTVHNRLIVGLADLLTPLLLPKYQIDIDKRVYEVIGVNTVLIGRPDVTVQESRSPRQLPKRSATQSAAATKRPVSVTLPMSEEVREAYLEVKDAQTQAVITAIEILSPTNKRGDGRQKYIEKRQQILQSGTHLVEIDLLFQGEPLPIAERNITSDYRLLISRSQNRPTADLYPFDLPEPIPAFPLPLAPVDPEPTIDLQFLLDQVYQRSGYDYFIDYQQTTQLPLPETTLRWIDQLLRAQNVRH